jgi:hypothetical protein
LHHRRSAARHRGSLPRMASASRALIAFRASPRLAAVGLG